MKKFITRVETAKIVRKELKRQFPSTKFSVRSTPNTSNICVSWIDGPAVFRVNTVIKSFEGAHSCGSMYCGEEVQFGARYVHAHRRYSRSFLEKVVTAFCTHWNYDSSKVRFSGSPDDAYVNVYPLGSYQIGQTFQKLLFSLDEKDAHRPYDDTKRQEKRDESKQEAPRQSKAEAERIAKQKFHSSRKIPFYTKKEALNYLGLPDFATKSQITTTFIKRVKEAADGRGGYKEDMNLVVKAKEKALEK